MARSGRPELPREAQVAFWDGIRAGLGAEAAVAAGAGRSVAVGCAAAGGVKRRAVVGSGRYLSLGEREEIALGWRGGCRAG